MMRARTGHRALARARPRGGNLVTASDSSQLAAWVGYGDLCIVRPRMGDAYTPGLTVTGSTVVRKARRLPLPGEVVVRLGDRVAATNVVARTELPGQVTLVNIANKLGCAADEVEATLRTKPGEVLTRGRVVAEKSSFFGLLHSRIESPIDGTLESVSSVTGQAVLREVPTAVEVRAYIDGEVVEELPGEGVVVETRGAMVQGIFGLAGEACAALCLVSARPGQTLEAEQIEEQHAGRIIIAGGRASLAALRRAVACRVAGVICGGFAYQDVKELLGYDVGVAVTGTEPIGTTLMVTEGFGDIAMARATFELLAAHDGDRASINGATQIRAGVIRPEVVIPERDAKQPEVTGLARAGLELGAPVRCIRAPYFGRIGSVVELPVELQTMPSETRVRVVAVELEGAERIMVPRANVEVIER
jgi:hypothetical protein